MIRSTSRNWSQIRKKNVHLACQDLHTDTAESDLVPKRMWASFDQHWFQSWVLENENTDFVNIHGTREKDSDCSLSWLQLCCYQGCRSEYLLCFTGNHTEFLHVANVRSCKLKGLCNLWNRQLLSCNWLCFLNKILSYHLLGMAGSSWSPWWSINVCHEFMTTI